VTKELLSNTYNVAFASHFGAVDVSSCAEVSPAEILGLLTGIPQVEKLFDGMFIDLLPGPAAIELLKPVSSGPQAMNSLCPKVATK
jgi:hypothetical protein